MAGKNTKNPLLTGASISFPFENFTTNALLVPVSQNETSLIPEEIEADSFLGQEPLTGSSSLKKLTSTVSKSFSSHSLSIGYSEPALTPDIRNQFVSEPQLIPTQSTIPVFTQSYTGSSSPAKPTPVYANALDQHFNKTLKFESHQGNSDECTLLPTEIVETENKFNQPFIPHTGSLLHSNHSSSLYTPPTIFTPVQTTASNPSPSTHSVHTPVTDTNTPPPQPIFNYFSAPEITQQNNTITNNQIIGQLSLPPVSSVPLQQSASTDAPPPPRSGGSHNSYRLNNIKRPTYTRPPDLSVTPMAAMPTLCTSDNIVAPSPTATLFTPAPRVVERLDTTAAPTQPQPSVPILSSSPALTRPPSLPSAATTLSTPSTPAPTVLPPSFASLAQGTSYRPVYHHWFFKKIVEGKVLWYPFSMNDSLALEQAFTSPTISPDTKVATDGGRYDVEVLRRRKTAVYWEEDPGEVRRCSWFVKGSMDARFVPYEENVATMLEEEYRMAATSNEWNRHVALPDGEVIIIHSPNAIAHHTRSASPDVWGNSPQMQQKPRVVKRGMDEFDISEGEPEKVDHLLFLVHGIGKFCDLKFRPVTEVVDDFRSVSLQLLQSHFRSAVEAGQASRIEVLPVSWHQALHNDDIDSRLNNITLRSIPRLRHFTNDTLLDILFYTSPVFCETIVQAVGNELNRLYNLFLARNPGFQGGVSLGGHSLGSLILFDMLCNQAPVPSPSSPSPNVATTPSTPTPDGQDISGEEEVKTLGCMKTQKARLSRTVSYVAIGTAGTGQPFISYPQLVFHPKAFFALGSPIGMFVTVRGIESLGEDFALPTCPMFFNIFHPFDPVAYRIESLINTDFAKYSPVLIPHHKGRKRMHLELRDTLEHVGTALKQRLIESVKSTWNTVYQLAMFHRSDANEHSIEQEVNKVLENEIRQSCPSDDHSGNQTPDSIPEPDIKMGSLNGGRRIDYVLQEAPLESFNEYLFALSSHVCYWESEDTMLMMLKEIYGTMNISPDTQVVQQILPFEMPDGSGTNYAPGTNQYQPLPLIGGMDPTAPPSDNVNVGPPPMSGFVRR